MIETVSKKVAPSQEQYTINIMSCFGWHLKSSQEINSKESHLERRGDDLYSVTSKENYVKLLFERDTSMPNYAQIVSLERQYNAIPSKPVFDKKNILISVLLLFLVFPVGVVFLLYTIYKAYKEMGRNKSEKGAPILAEARRLL